MSGVCIKCQTPKERTVCCNKILHCKECNRIRALDYYNCHKENRQQKNKLYYYENKETVLRKEKNDVIVIKQNLIRDNASDII